MRLRTKKDEALQNGFSAPKKCSGELQLLGVRESAGAE